MGDVTGFLKWPRRGPSRRPVPVRLLDWHEVYEPFAEEELRHQAGRCMDCGIPFCNNGCPLGNLIPDWNDLVYRDNWREAIERLHATNNFPEFTGRLCPAPCEAACVLGINSDPVTIKQVEVEIIDRAWDEGWVEAQPPALLTGKSVAVVGSGPAGLAAAQQLTRAGHRVVVFERADRIGGLLRYGIPEFKMEKRFLDRRLDQMRAEGTEFRADIAVGVDVTIDELDDEFDAIVFAAGATAWRDLPIPGRELGGIHQAMEFLPLSNRVQEGDLDASADHRRRQARRDHRRRRHGRRLSRHRASARCGRRSPVRDPPEAARRARSTNPWPKWSMIYRTSSAHEEGGERVFSVNTECFLGDDDGNVRGLGARGRDASTDASRRSTAPTSSCRASSCSWRWVSSGPNAGRCSISSASRSTVGGTWIATVGFQTSVDGVFACGDMGRGQILIVWAIAEGRSCAASVDRWLTGDTTLPSPIRPTTRPLV